MSRPRRRITLAGIIDGPGGHVAAWRHPATQADAQLDLDFHVRNARTLERGLFDAVFIADIVAVWGTHLDSLCHTSRAEHFEPLTLLAAYAAATEHIGLAATATTTYNEPHHIARRYASLDHLSGGRAAWNVVTSAAPWESVNFGRADHLEHGRRYERAEEFIDVVKQLWDAGADLRDGLPGTPVHHHGEHFDVVGPLDVARPRRAGPSSSRQGPPRSAGSSRPATPKSSSRATTGSPTPRTSTPTSRPESPATAATRRRSWSGRPSPRSSPEPKPRPAPSSPNSRTWCPTTSPCAPCRTSSAST